MASDTLTYIALLPMEVSKKLLTPLLIAGGICALLAGVAILLLDKEGDVETTSEALVSNARASTTVPYVTETEEFMTYLRNTLPQIGSEALQVRLLDLYANDAHGEQHMAFHYFGEVLYEEEGANGLPLCENWYGFGCFHGFLLTAIDIEGYQVVPLLDEACAQANKTIMDIETCHHGIGHGLVEFAGRDADEAVEVCDMVHHVYEKLGCASGVFMEYFSPTQSEKRIQVVGAPEFDKDNPLNVCRDYTGLRLATCLFEIHPWWQNVAKYDPQTVEKMCNSVEDEEAREFCLIGYGNFKGPIVDQALPFCDQFVDPESHALCRAGIFWSAEHFNDEKDPMKACRDLPEQYRQFCVEKGRFTCHLENSCNREPSVRE